MRIFRSILIFSLFTLTAALLFSQEGPDALQLYQQGRYEQAVEVTLQELEAAPRNMNSYSVLTWSLVELREYRRALDYAQQALQLVPYEPRLIEVSGEAHYYLGNNIDALEYFELYATIAPRGFRIDRVYYFMGEIFLRLEEYNRADIAFSTAVYHTSELARWWTRLGYARELAEDFPYALEAYNRALTLNSGYQDALRGKERVNQKIQNEG